MKNMMSIWSLILLYWIDTMKRYIKANNGKPTLDSIRIEWEELDDSIQFTVYSKDDQVLFTEVFDYNDIDADLIPESAAEFAYVALSQEYELSDDVITTLQQVD